MFTRIRTGLALLIACLPTLAPATVLRSANAQSESGQPPVPAVAVPHARSDAITAAHAAIFAELESQIRALADSPEDQQVIVKLRNTLGFAVNSPSTSEAQAEELRARLVIVVSNSRVSDDELVPGVLLRTTRVAMFEHPTNLELIAQRTLLTMKLKEHSDAFECGRLIASQPHHADRESLSVRSALKALNELGLDTWSKSKADAKLSRPLLRRALDAAIARSQQLTPGASATDWALASLAESLAQAKDILAAKRTAYGIHDNASFAAAYAAIASTQADSADIDGAFATVKEIPAGPARNTSLVSITRAQAKSGNFPAALQTAALIADDPARYADALTAIAQAHAAKGDFPAAESTIATIPDPAARSRANITIVQAHITAGNLPAADKAAASIEHPASRCRARCLLAAAEAHARDTAAAIATIERAKADSRAAQTDEPADAPRLMHEIAGAQAHTGRIADAIATATSLPTPAQIGGTLTLIADIQSASGDTDGAIRTTGAIENRVMRALALRNIALVQHSRGDASGAAHTLGLAEAIAARAYGPESAPLLTLALAQASAKCGDIATAERAIETIDDQGTLDILRASIAQIQAESPSDDSIALNIQLAMREPNARTAIARLIGTAKGLLNARQVDAPK